MKALLLTLLLLIPVSANAADPVTGLWLTENKRAVIHLNECGDELCGSIFWIIDGGMQFDEKNPVPELKDRKLCGLQIIDSLEKTGEGEWENGNIYKADDGDTYSADMTLQDNGTLKVRGYMGISLFGKTQIWTRADQQDYKRCR